MSADQDLATDQLESVTDITQDSDIGFRNGSFIVAPIPFSNPAIGSGLAVGGGYLFSLGDDIPTSHIGVGGLRSDNKTTGYGATTSLAFPAGWMFDLTVAYADLRYDLFLGPLDIPLRQEGILARGEVGRKVSDRWTVGLAFRYLESAIAPDIGAGVLPPELTPDIDVEIMSVGLTAEWDTRDDTDYPTDGARFTLAANYASETDGARDYIYAHVNYDLYRALGPQTVVSGRDRPVSQPLTHRFLTSARWASPIVFVGFRRPGFLTRTWCRPRWNCATG